MTYYPYPFLSRLPKECVHMIYTFSKPRYEIFIFFNTVYFWLGSRFVDVPQFVKYVSNEPLEGKVLYNKANELAILAGMEPKYNYAYVRSSSRKRNENDDSNYLPKSIREYLERYSEP